MNNGEYAAQLERKVISLQRNTAGLLQLLGGSDDDELRFWGILKGITTPATFLVVSHILDEMDGQVEQLQETVKTLELSAPGLGG